ncbi:MAG TPA: dihydrofolate reductase family protein [Actinoplanes sp.]|nr:dihydrofolate reductase family protein [Actinoplanes sp.]
MKTQYFTATSFDGYIADENNSLDWLSGVAGRGESPFGEFFQDVGAFAMGATTYEWILALDDPQAWLGPYGDTPAWIFTNRGLPAVPGADIHFVRGDVRPVHAAMTRAAAGRNLWLAGGGDLVGQFDDAGLLDEVILGVAPVALGAGAPVLPRRILSSRLTLTSARQLGPFAYLTYDLHTPA